MDLLRTVYVENLPLATNEIILKEAFSVFGKIDKLDLPTFGPEHPLVKISKRTRNKGYAFIEFTDVQSVQRACDHFNDINNILRYDIKSKRDTDDPPTEVSDRFELLLRVMPKQRFLTLSNRYEEQRFRSMVNAAKFLLVAS